MSTHTSEKHYLNEGSCRSSCFVCGTPILDLDGIELYLDTYMLSGEAAQAICDEGHFGGCHTGCLTLHACGTAWANALRRHFEDNLKFVLIEQRGEVVVLRDRRSAQFVLLRSTGRYFIVSEREYDSACVSGRPISRTGSRRVHVEGGADFNSWFQNALQTVEGVSLGEVYARLGAPEHVFKGIAGTARAAADQPDLVARVGGFDGKLQIAYLFNPFS